MIKNLNVAVVQHCAKKDIEENIARVETLIRAAVEKGARIVIIPENFCFIGGLKNKLDIAESLSRPGKILSRMQTLSAKLGIYLVIGSMPTLSEIEGHFRNTTIVLNPKGEILTHYHKIHLFDVSIDNQVHFMESDYVEPGDQIVSVEIEGWIFGLSICYDLRFPELYRDLAKRGAHVLLVPAAFTSHTGAAHWLPLLQARAIENQCYLLAANQVGEHSASRSSYGRSAIIDPWGTLLSQLSDDEGIASAILNFETLEKIRTQLPALKHVKI